MDGSQAHVHWDQVSFQILRWFLPCLFSPSDFCLQDEEYASWGTIANYRFQVMTLPTHCLFTQPSQWKVPGTISALMHHGDLVGIHRVTQANIVDSEHSSWDSQGMQGMFPHHFPSIGCRLWWTQVRISGIPIRMGFQGLTLSVGRIAHQEIVQLEIPVPLPQLSQAPTLEFDTDVVAGVCADLLLSYQRNSVGVIEGGDGGDEGGCGGF